MDNISSTNNSRIIRVRDLPIYYDTNNGDMYRTNTKLDENLTKRDKINPNWLYSSVSQVRQSIQQIWNDNKEIRERFVRTIETGEAHAKATFDYIRDDQTILPKIGVVTIAGLGGLLLGHRASRIRKAFYSSVAATVALSACYPKQSANLLDQVYLRIKHGTENIFHQTNSSSIPNIRESKDRILHTIKSLDEPIVVAIKGDYGQGTPADQHLYTTRGVQSTTEKKL